MIPIRRAVHYIPQLTRSALCSIRAVSTQRNWRPEHVRQSLNVASGPMRRCCHTGVVDGVPPPFDVACIETLNALGDYFEEILEASKTIKTYDVLLENGVLTVQLGSNHGTYVINRQSPNSQIWLSSPITGPKRYDFIDGCWVYKKTGETLHDLLQNEIATVLQPATVSFGSLPFAQKCGTTTQ